MKSRLHEVRGEPPLFNLQEQVTVPEGGERRLDDLWPIVVDCTVVLVGLKGASLAFRDSRVQWRMLCWSFYSLCSILTPTCKPHITSQPTPLNSLAPHVWVRKGHAFFYHSTLHTFFLNSYPSLVESMKEKQRTKKIKENKKKHWSWYCYRYKPFKGGILY